MSAADTALNGTGVLITRPHPQGEPLAAQLRHRGARPILLPAIEILGPQEPGPIRALLQQIERFHLGLFVSANAVTWGLRLLGTQPLPPTLQIGAIGSATARELKRNGIAVDLCPEGRSDSESLLALPPLQQLKGQQILIFRGNGGRELLANTLCERGAEVTYAEVYRRQLPHYDPAALQLPWSQIAVTIVTSSETLGNLLQLVGTRYHHALLERQLIVVSPRTAQLAETLGFRNVLLAEGADDASLMDAVQRSVSERVTARPLHAGGPR